jgi:hypothetical protein
MMKYKKYYYPEMPLTRMVHKSNETGTPSKIHPRINTRAHLPIIQKKTVPREPHLGSADTMGRPTP